MRVLMLSWEYPPYVTGGMGTHVAGLAPALARAGVEVHLIAPQLERSPVLAHLSKGNGADREVTNEGVSVYWVPLVEDGRGIYAQAQQTNQAMLSKGQTLLNGDAPFDVIHAHDWLTVFSAEALKYQHSMPLVGTMHATERGRLRSGFLETDLQRSIHDAECRLASEAWRLITCSQFMAAEVQTFFATPPEKVDVVPNGVNSYQNGRWSKADLAACRARYAADDSHIVFAVGRLVHEKGFHLLIDAAPQILSEFPNTRFVIAGRGPEASRLADHAQRLGVSEQVCLSGYISDDERDCLYHVAACAVFPSLYEPFGIVALEAMVAGCPVVVADVGGLGEVVRHGVTGVTIYPNDARSVAWGVLHILRSPAQAAERAEEARLTVRHEYNWDTIASKTVAVYQHALEKREKITAKA